MKKLSSLVLVFLACLGINNCSSNKTSNDVALDNGSFESGVLAPWTVFQTVQANVSCYQAHSQKCSLMQAGEPGSVYQDVKGLTPGTTYTVSAWISGAAGATATSQIAVFDADANLPTFSPAFKPVESWQQVRFNFTPKSPGKYRIHLFRLAGSGAIYWDDVTLTHAP